MPDGAFDVRLEIDYLQPSRIGAQLAPNAAVISTSDEVGDAQGDGFGEATINRSVTIVQDNRATHAFRNRPSGNGVARWPPQGSIRR
jgi:hypothetical protein